jgi:hypothetical protein
LSPPQRMETSPDYLEIFIEWGIRMVLTVGGCLRFPDLRRDSVDMTTFFGGCVGMTNYIEE